MARGARKHQWFYFFMRAGADFNFRHFRHLQFRHSFYLSPRCPEACGFKMVGVMKISSSSFSLLLPSLLEQPAQDGHVQQAGGS